MIVFSPTNQWKSNHIQTSENLIIKDFWYRNLVFGVQGVWNLSNGPFYVDKTLQMSGRGRSECNKSQIFKKFSAQRLRKKIMSNILCDLCPHLKTFVRFFTLYGSLGSVIFFQNSSCLFCRHLTVISKFHRKTFN